MEKEGKIKFLVEVGIDERLRKVANGHSLKDYQREKEKKF